jgi:hypothetical protein
MNLKLSRKGKAATGWVAAPAAPTGGLNSQPDARWGNLPSVQYDPYQEVTVISVTAFNEKAAVASAASSAHLSALLSNFIVPSLHRKAMAFHSFLSTFSSRNLFQPIKLPPRSS